MATLSDDDGFYLGLKARRGDAIERIGDEIDRAVRDDGTDAVVLGCTCMSVATADLQRRSDVPVVDPLASGFLQAVSLARLEAGQNRALFRPPPVARDDVLEAMVSAAATVLEREGEGGEDCEVCMVGEQSGASEPATSEVSAP
jgi:allantoin racemase